MSNLEYTGPKSGDRLIHRRIVSADIFSKMKADHEFYMEIFRKEELAGLQTVKKMVPDAVHRKGCTFVTAMDRTWTMVGSTRDQTDQVS